MISREFHVFVEREIVEAQHAAPLLSQGLF